MLTLAAETTFVTAIWSIVGAIMALAIFFKAMRWLEYALNKGKGPAKFSLKGVLDRTTFVTVHVSGGEKYEDVRILGYTDSSAEKGIVPWELTGMVVLEHRDGGKTVISAKRIRSIEIPATDRATD
ncbi:MAG: hypothetical protein ACIAQF_09410 [Phycisphaerales bacterium JB065]